MIKSIYYSLTCSNEEGHELMIGQTIYINTYQKKNEKLDSSSILSRVVLVLCTCVYTQQEEVTDDESRK